MRSHHLTFTTVGLRTLTRDEREIRSLVRTLARCAGPRLMLFSVVDDHLHALVRTDRPRVLTWGLVRALGAVLPHVEFLPTHSKPVASRDHMRSLVAYFFRQPRKHRLRQVHSALWTGSAFLDLAGLRILPGYGERPLLSELPSLALLEFVHEVDLPAWPIPQASDGQLRAAGVARVLEAAGAVHAVGPAPRGRGRGVLDARGLAAQVCLEVGFRPRGIRSLMATSERTLRRLFKRPLEPSARTALRRRITLEDYVRSQPRAA